MTIMAGKTKYSTIAILFTCIALIFMASGASAQEDKKESIQKIRIKAVDLSASAQEDKKERGYKGTITKDKLLSEFQNKKICHAEGYVIEGNDIISIIEETDCDIKINNSVIKGGLDFTKLPGASIDQLSLPEEWSEKEREEFKKKGKVILFVS